MQNNHPDVKFGKTGVLLVNLGTPDSTNWWDIRRYLKEFLSDKRVIEVNPVLWQIILNLFILRTQKYIFFFIFVFITIIYFFIHYIIKLILIYTITLFIVFVGLIIILSL